MTEMLPIFCGVSVFFYYSKVCLYLLRGWFCQCKAGLMVPGLCHSLIPFLCQEHTRGGKEDSWQISKSGACSLSFLMKGNPRAHY